MEISNWIALGALLVAILGLIPQFYQIFNKNKKHKNKITLETKNAKPDTSQKPSQENKLDISKNPKKEDEPMPFMLRILVLVIFAFASLLIEMILFGAIAHFFGVKMNLETMTLVWKIISFSLFLIPGTFLFLALVTLSANMED